jgi:peptidyl-prolyl cis-trans isomerase A (cyclophilin A)
VPKLRAALVSTGMFLATLGTIACGGEAEPPEAENNPLMNPDAFDDTAPAEFRASFETSAGTFVVQVHREWAPEGADRFYNLVQSGYFDDTRFFRVIEGFMAQFGMNADPYVTAAWSQRPILDDSVTQSNERGRLTFAATGQPNSRTTQVFINLVDNPQLDGMGFAPIGEVVEGMDVVDALYSGYGEAAPRGQGPLQQNIRARGNEYLEESFPELDYVVTARVL